MMKMILLAGLFGLSFFPSTHADPLAVGAVAPEVKAPDQDGKIVDLGPIFATGTTLVYFYPKAGTPGCTAQACSLRDSFTDLRAKGVTVIGVSHDKPEAQKNFQNTHKLPFTLIADSDRKVAEAFGVPSMIFGMDKRQSFLIRDGKIVWRDTEASTARHGQDVLQALASLPKAS